ncbi:MAG: FAD-binding protein [Deltaproteobacteria bacterium]|nr:FAD-binding protein [Deltaproteobacteria bacterium]
MDASYQPITPALEESIRQAVTPARVISEKDRLEEFSNDSSEFSAIPEVVVEATSASQIQSLLRLANRHRFPVTPRGTGSGLVGGAVPVFGGVVLSLARMNRIIAIDRNNLIAVVEPGVITLDLKESAQREGLFYPPDPASLDTSSIGGNAATNAGGPSCVKYGTTRDYVLGIEAVLPNGEIVRSGVQTRKGVVGYDLAHLLVGSEGTLGIITKLILKLLPHPPALTTLVAFFPDIVAAMEAVSKTLVKGHLPCALEFLDGRCLSRVSDLVPFEDMTGVKALLLIELDGLQDIIKREIEDIGVICMESGAREVLFAPDSIKRMKLWEMRREVSLRIEAAYPLWIPEDVVVPISRIADFVAALPAFEDEYGMTIYTFGHAGDGNIHVNITAETTDLTDRIEKGVERLLKLVVAMDGTISGEHGIGWAKKRYLPLELSHESIRLQRGIKDLFDPLCILNPGKIF